LVMGAGFPQRRCNGQVAAHLRGGADRLICADQREVESGHLT
jgi:hypothetical protein